ncbi:tyrosine-type recombinase/integrase [Halorubrum gandharaense]
MGRNRDINDPSGVARRARRQIELAQEHDHGDDGKAMVRWGNEMAQQGMASTTISNRLNSIRKIAERAPKPLVEFESADDVTELLGELKSGEHPDAPDDGFAGGTLRMYRQAARVFFRDELDRDWAEDIKIGQPDPSPIQEEDIFTNDEVDALLAASTNPRDSAMIAFLCVTGQRISATLSIRVGDVDLDGRVGKVTLNSEAEGLKGASGPRPLLWSRSYIASWLENHPARDDEDAPLFCCRQGGRRPREDGGFVEWEAGGVLSTDQARNRLRDVAEEAGIETSKMRPHSFRHTAITRMRDEEVPDDRIRFMVGVDEKSNVLERYDKAENDRMLSRIREHYGIEEQDRSPVGRPTTEHCSNCQEPIRSSARFCPSCGTPRTVEAAETADEFEDDLFKDGIDAASDDDTDLSREDLIELQEIISKPGVKRLLLSEE